MAKFLVSLELMDIRYSTAIHRSKLGLADYLLVVPGMIFGQYIMPFTLLSIYFSLGRNACLLAVLSTLLTVAVTAPMKKTTKRMRPNPATLASRKFNVRSLEHNFSMPSGDSAQAAVVCTSLAIATGSPIWLCGIPAAMFARVYFGCHWIGDTIIGAAIGTSIVSFLTPLVIDYTIGSEYKL